MRVHKALSFCVTVRKAAVALTLGSLVVLPSRDDVDLVAGNADILEQVIVQLRKRPEGPAIALVGANFRKYMGEIHGASSCCAFCAVPKSIQIGLVPLTSIQICIVFQWRSGKSPPPSLICEVSGTRQFS